MHWWEEEPEIIKTAKNEFRYFPKAKKLMVFQSLNASLVHGVTIDLKEIGEEVRQRLIGIIGE